MMFFFHFVYIVDYIDRFLYIEHSRISRMKPTLIMVDDLYYEFLDSVASIALSIFNQCL